MSLFGRTEATRDEQVRHGAIKKNITSFFAASIKKLQREHVNSEQPVQSEAAANHVCSSLEAVFLHEIKGSFSHKLSGYITGSTSVPEGQLSFWGFLVKFTHKDVLSQLNHLGQITTEVGMCRAWIRLALNDGVIESYMDAISKDANTIRQYYKRTSYWRDTEQIGIFKSFIQGLSSFQFTLSYNSSILNVWSSTPLALCGLNNAPLPTLTDRDESATARLRKLNAQEMGGTVEVGVMGYRNTGPKTNNGKTKEAQVNGAVPRTRILSDVSAESAIDAAECLSSDNCTSENGDSGHWTENSTDIKVNFKKANKTSDSNSNKLLGKSNKEGLAGNTHNDSVFNNISQAQSITEEEPTVFIDPENGKIYENVTNNDAQCSNSSDKNRDVVNNIVELNQEDVPGDLEIYDKNNTEEILENKSNISSVGSEFSHSFVDKESLIVNTEDVPYTKLDSSDHIEKCSSNSLEDFLSCGSNGASEISVDSKTQNTSGITASVNKESMIEKFFSSAKEKVQMSHDGGEMDGQENVVEIIHKKRKRKVKLKGHSAKLKLERKIENVDNISINSDAYTESSAYSGTDSLDAQSSCPDNFQEDVNIDECHTNIIDEPSEPVTEQTESHILEEQEKLFENPSQLSSDIAKLNEETLDLLAASCNKETDIYSGFTDGPGAKPKVFTERSPSEDSNPFSNSSASPQGAVANNGSPPGFTERRKSGVLAPELSSATVTNVERASDGMTREISAASIHEHLKQISVSGITGYDGMSEEISQILSSGSRHGSFQGNSLGTLDGYGWSSQFQARARPESPGSGSYHDLVHGYGSSSEPPRVEQEPQAEPEVEPNRSSYSVSPAEEAGAEYEILNFSDILSNIEELEDCYKRLSSEKGLDLQNYQCKGCTRPIGIIYGNPRVCAFDGYNYCFECHENDEALIPAKIVHNWDFHKHKVSRRCLEYLTLCDTKPLLNVEEMNPRIYDHISDMNDVKDIRLQLQHLKAYLYTCKQSVADELRQRVWPREHLYEDIHLYSTQDLQQVLSGQLTTTLRKVIKFAVKHVYECTLCTLKGFICEICNSSKVIFPFELETTVKCKICNAVFHKDCKADLRPCPRCERRRARMPAHHPSSDHMDYAYMPKAPSIPL